MKQSMIHPILKSIPPIGIPPYSRYLSEILPSDLFIFHPLPSLYNIFSHAKIYLTLPDPRPLELHPIPQKLVGDLRHRAPHHPALDLLPAPVRPLHRDHQTDHLPFFAPRGPAQSPQPRLLHRGPHRNTGRQANKIHKY